MKRKNLERNLVTNFGCVTIINCFVFFIFDVAVRKHSIVVFRDYDHEFLKLLRHVSLLFVKNLVLHSELQQFLFAVGYDVNGILELPARDSSF